MNKIKTSLCGILDFLLIGCLGILFCNHTLIEESTNTASSSKYLPSRYLVYEEVKEQEEEAVEEVVEEVIEEPTKEVIEEEKVELEVTEEVIVEQEEPEAVLETLIGSMSGYGPDCIGCTSNKTASGYYVGEGNIYYQDPTYGKVRILAGDSKYPFYTIVRINDANLSDEPILGIVLDRGSAIGIGKKYMFDLLYASEKDAATLGVSSNVTFEILRIGK